MKCSVLMLFVLVSSEIRFTLKIKIRSLVSNAKYKNKLLCSSTTGHLLPLFFFD